jgi:hypothetical protein
MSHLMRAKNELGYFGFDGDSYRLDSGDDLHTTLVTHFFILIVEALCQLNQCDKQSRR